MTDLRDYARQLADFYKRNGHGGDPYRILADHGEANTFTPLPEGETCGQAKNCYGNATLRALDFFGNLPPLTYYEGLCHDFMPFEHAWCQDADGRVYDVTLRHQDDRCAFCHGEGEIHPTDHWDYRQPDDDEDEEFLDDAETITCEQCDGTGKTEPVDRSGVTYLGVPVSADTLRRCVVEKGTYGVLFDRPDLVAEDLGVSDAA